LALRDCVQDLFFFEKRDEGEKKLNEKMEKAWQKVRALRFVTEKNSLC